ncbi:hypothetical protein, conserved [Babesia bigemina]|uniref:Uncharacterized protein n=1 Tax=Babesia bigemina TaxID=5866 RepID=A0A061D6N1_BABBI|nr:hypothetical protein, conserved [Babesia bigemina]CDR94604.1 hypothetical protein, conserved [Babesia bigemina]|eukprot:XP_012766790.1 hypothetical protein, conserved [Babesia bigemina]
MSRSTNSLIAEQCYLINRDTPRPQNQKRRIHNILSNQISSLNNSDSLVLNEQASEQPPSEETSYARAEGARRPATRPQKRPSAAQNKSSNNSFIQLLTGDAVSDAATAMSAQSRLRQQIAQTHVMKCLGGFKYLEGNAFDNFVVATLPRFDAQNNFKST